MGRWGNGVGERLEREEICIYIWLIHLILQQKPRHRCKKKKNYTLIKEEKSEFIATKVSEVCGEGHQNLGSHVEGVSNPHGASLQLFCRSDMSDSFTPMDCSTPDFPVLQHLPEFAQTQVHFHPTISSSVARFFFCLNFSQHQGLFQMSQLFASGESLTKGLVVHVEVQEIL